MKKIFALYILLSVFMSSCIDEVKLTQESLEPKLIVDGSITNAKGPYQVTLSYSLPYTEVGITQSISGAKLTIIEEGGKSAILKETSTGFYQTDSADIRGQVGKSYYLKIRLGNGREYQSKPETILPSIPIDTFKVGFVPNILNPKPFTVSIKTKDPVEKGNFYRWKWTHYDSISICKTTYLRNDFGAFKYLYPCCDKCWDIVRCQGCIDIGSDALINGKFIEPTIANLPFESKTPYFIILEQYHISKEYYQFWKTVETQINNSGGIFDNAPAQVLGNLYNINDEKDQVLGYFSASGVTLKPVYVPRDFTGYAPRVTSELPNTTVIYQTSCQVCGGSTRTKQKPLGWKD
jgi:hypothetical protein